MDQELLSKKDSIVLLTSDEEKKLESAFDAFNRDKSGYLDAFQLKNVLEMMG